MIKLPDIVQNKFYYFAFGSNLLEKRLKILNKSAERFGVGILKDYKLNFGQFVSRTWNGSPATIKEHKGSEVIGVVWTINIDQMDYLDVQEGVSAKIYKPLNVMVSVRDKEVNCRTYQLFDNPELILDLTQSSFERQPSHTYLNVIVNGAIESNLPEHYIKFLKSTKHNGRQALDQSILAALDLKDLLQCDDNKVL